MKEEHPRHRETSLSSVPWQGRCQAVLCHLGTALLQSVTVQVVSAQGWQTCSRTTSWLHGSEPEAISEIISRTVTRTESALHWLWDVPRELVEHTFRECPGGIYREAWLWGPCLAPGSFLSGAIPCFLITMNRAAALHQQDLPPRHSHLGASRPQAELWASFFNSC